ncbi:hypothetical protein [Acinetobacter sp. YH12251]|nr:hypothetical protein [Acinetobacter sp. YH12251]
MCVHQTEKTVQDLDIINQLILGDTSNEKSGIYKRWSHMFEQLKAYL